MKLHELRAAEGSTKNRKRRGRGTATGQGKTKRGFTNIFGTEYTIINVEDLNRFEAGTEVTPELLKELGMVKQVKDGIKILGNGTLNIGITVKAHKFTKSAIEKIEAAGGKAEVI